MSDPVAEDTVLLAALNAERFPSEGEVRREARRRPAPLVGPTAPGTEGFDDDVTVARRRQILNTAMTPAPVPHRGYYAA